MVPQLRSHATIAERIIDHQIALSPEMTDFVEGGVLRSIDDSVAVVLQGVEYAAFDSARQAILTAAYSSFQFAKLPAVPSGGTVTFTRTATSAVVTIPLGYKVSVPGSSVRVYETLTVGVLDVGITTISIPVRCTTIGTIGNTAGATVTNLLSIGFNGIVTNALPFLSGQEEETDESRFQRFQLYIANLSRGTAAAIETAARSVVRYDTDGNPLERVVSVKVIEPFQGDPTGRLGLVQVYIDNGSGTASAQLKTLVEQVLIGYVDENGRHPGWVAAGIELRVFQVAAVPVTVSCVIVVAPAWNTAQVVSQVEDALEAYLNGLAVFAPVITAELITAVMNVDGVADVIFDSPLANVPITGRAVAGAITVTA